MDFLLKRQELSCYSEFLPCSPGIKRRGKQSTVASSTVVKQTDFFFNLRKKTKQKNRKANKVPTYPSSLSSISSVCWRLLSFVAFAR